MRYIEFRGLRKDGKGWVYGVPFHIYEEDKCFMINNCQSSTLEQEDTDFQGVEVIPSTVGQYAGVDDFDGEKLYEDDRVAWVDFDGVDREDVIKWVNGGFILCNDMYTVGSLFKTVSKPTSGKKLKKVGNIHEGGEK